MRSTCHGKIMPPWSQVLAIVYALDCSACTRTVYHWHPGLAEILTVDPCDRIRISWRDWWRLRFSACLTQTWIPASPGTASIAINIFEVLPHGSSYSDMCIQDEKLTASNLNVLHTEWRTKDSFLPAGSRRIEMTTLGLDLVLLLLKI